MSFARHNTSTRRHYKVITTSMPKQYAYKKDKYSRTSMARTPLGPWKFVRDSGSSSLGRLLLVPHQEAQ